MLLAMKQNSQKRQVINARDRPAEIVSLPTGVFMPEVIITSLAHAAPVAQGPLEDLESGSGTTSTQESQFAIVYKYCTYFFPSSSSSSSSSYHLSPPILENAMSEQAQKVIPAQLGFLAIYNPSLGTTDETLENQIVYYFSTESRGEKSHPQDPSGTKAIHDAIREQNNERLRQIGLAQGMVEFGRSFSEGKSVDTIETEKSRIVLHELEAGWWILAVRHLVL